MCILKIPLVRSHYPINYVINTFKVVDQQQSTILCFFSFDHRLWQVPYYWAGIKMYDFVAGTQNLRSSYFLSKARALEQFPMLKKNKLVGAIVYYDGKSLTYNVYSTICF